MLRTRESEQDRHDVSGSEAHKDETDKPDHAHPVVKMCEEPEQSEKDKYPGECEDSVGKHPLRCSLVLEGVARRMEDQVTERSKNATEDQG